MADMGTESAETDGNTDEENRQDPPDGNTDGKSKTDDDDDGADADKWKALARRHENDAKRARRELEELRKAGQTDAEKALDEARRQAREEARKEAIADTVTAFVELEASAKLADPTYARLLDDDDRATFVDADGAVDRKAIARAIDGLVKKHPELAKAGATGAPLPGGGKNTKPGGFDMNDAIRRAAGRA